MIPQTAQHCEGLFQRIPALGQVVTSQQHVFRLETGVSGFRVLETLDEEAASDQGNQRERNLGHHQRTTKRSRPYAGRNAPATLAQDVLSFAPESSPRRREAAKDSGPQTQRERKE